MAVRNIEQFFLNTLLRVSIAGILVVLLTDLLIYPEDLHSITIDLVVLSGCVASYLVRQRNSFLSVLIISVIVLASMLYQCIVVPFNTTTSLSIVLLIGFIISVMLKGWPMWIMHGATISVIQTIFIIQYFYPHKRFSPAINDLVTVAITYSILYFILTYATGMLKAAYDRLYHRVRAAHQELQQKAREIESQNTALLRTQGELNKINNHLEGIISERTIKIKAQNETLLRYSYANAHHLRGPVARVLGLVSIYRLDAEHDIRFIMDRIEEQACEIDQVVKKINTDLEAHRSETMRVDTDEKQVTPATNVCK